MPLDEAKLEAAMLKAVKAWEVVDRHLSSDERPYMLGDALTFGDITCGVHVNRLYQMGEQGPKGRFAHLHALRAWYEALLQRARASASSRALSTTCSSRAGA